MALSPVYQMGTLRLVADTPIYTPINGRAKTEASALFAKFWCSGDGHDACVPVVPTPGCGEECGSTAHLVTAIIYWAHIFSLLFTEFLPGPCFPHFYWWGGWEDRTCSDSCGPLPGLLLPRDAMSLVCGLAFVFLPYDCNHSVRTMLCPVFFYSAWRKCLLHMTNSANLCHGWLSFHQKDARWLT